MHSSLILLQQQLTNVCEQNYSKLNFICEKYYRVNDFQHNQHEVSHTIRRIPSKRFRRNKNRFVETKTVQLRIVLESFPTLRVLLVEVVDFAPANTAVSFIWKKALLSASLFGRFSSPPSEGNFLDGGKKLGKKYARSRV